MDLFPFSVLGLVSVVLLAVCCLAWQLLRQNGRILLRLDELEKRLDGLEFGEDQQPKALPLGSEAPPFELPGLAGENVSLAQYRGHPLLLIFFNPSCGFCRELVPKLAAFLRDHSQPSTLNPQPPALLLITSGDAAANREFFGEHKLQCPVLLQKQTQVAAAYGANGTPSGYLLDAEGRIASDLAMGADALLTLASGAHSQPSTLIAQPAPDRFGNRSLARSKLKRDGLKAGTPAPDFRLPRLDGRGELALADLRGRRVLLVFSSPHCGPCNALAPELEKFHRHYPELELVMISKGEPKENRAKVKQFGLTFPIVLQQQWEISRLYAMFATPVAYLLDENGVILKDVAVGVEPILELMSSLPEPALRI